MEHARHRVGLFPKVAICLMAVLAAAATYATGSAVFSPDEGLFASWTGAAANEAEEGELGWARGAPDEGSRRRIREGGADGFEDEHRQRRRRSGSTAPAPSGEADAARTPRSRGREELTPATAKALRLALGRMPKASTRSRASRPSSRGGSSGAGHEEQRPDAEPESSALARYLADAGEEPEDVLRLADILANPSNIIEGDDSTGLLAWDVRLEEPRGSYLYSLEQDGQGRLSQIHRYFCAQRRLDILGEACLPIASVYSDGGLPVAVRYTEEGLPVRGEAEGVDPSLFSRRGAADAAEEHLLLLQAYFDSLRY